MSKSTNLALFLVVGSMASSTAQDDGRLLLQTPAISKNQIAFAYGGDIWLVDRDGGEAHRVVTGTGRASPPVFFA